MFIKVFVIVTKCIKHYKINNTISDFYDKINLSIKAALPNFSSKIQLTISQEIATIYYSLFSYWYKPQKQYNEFTYHKNNSAISLYWVFMFIALIETSIVHFVLYKYNLQRLSIVLLFLNIYTSLILLAHINAMKKRFNYVCQTYLKINNGVFISQCILYKNIKKIEPFKEEHLKDKSILRVGLIGKLESQNITIHFNEKQTVKLFYGINKPVMAIALYVDDCVEFENQIAEKLNKFTNLSH